METLEQTTARLNKNGKSKNKELPIGWQSPALKAFEEKELKKRIKRSLPKDKYDLNRLEKAEEKRQKKRLKNLELVKRNGLKAGQS